jgi:site-specific recombinase XerD
MNTKGDSTLKICMGKFKYLNYSEKTMQNYLSHIKKFLENQEKSCLHLNSNDFKSYLDNYNFTSISQQNQVINSIRFLYKEVLNKKYDKVSFKRPRKEKHLPKIIDSKSLIEKITNIQNLKHRSILSLAFSTGMRVSEIVNLKISNIDSKRMLIHIENAKGKKDRYVPLSENILSLLRIYFKNYKPKEYLFNGQNNLKYSIKSCQEIFKKHISKTESFHSLRHSCFTTMLESGIDTRIIQKIAGHSNIKTTEIYTHVSNNLLKNIKTPI